MGIYAKRNIKRDEELTFNYNVDRYGYVSYLTNISAILIWNAIDMTHNHVIAENRTALDYWVGRHRQKLLLWMTYISMVSTAD